MGNMDLDRVIVLINSKCSATSLVQNRIRLRLFALLLATSPMSPTSCFSGTQVYGRRFALTLDLMGIGYDLLPWYAGKPSPSCFPCTNEEMERNPS